jgi:hypothetical protein
MEVVLDDVEVAPGAIEKGGHASPYLLGAIAAGRVATSNAQIEPENVSQAAGRPSW